MTPLIWVFQGFPFLLKIRTLRARLESLTILEISSSFSYYPWQWFLEMEKKYSHVCFSCDVLCDTFASQAIAGFIVVFSVLREHVLCARMHQLIILQLLLIKVWFLSSSLSCVLTEVFGWVLVILISPNVALTIQLVLKNYWSDEWV